MTTAIIIEDEQPAAERLKKLILEIDPDIDVLTELDSIESSVAWLNSNESPDLIFLDIQLADGPSFDIAKRVKIDSFIIFTTAYDEYAIKAFELNSVDYLLKPIKKENLAGSIEKFAKISGKQQQFSINKLIETIENRNIQYKRRFLISSGSRINSIDIKHIAYFQSIAKNTFLGTFEGKNFPVDFSLDRLETLLDPIQFFRINRQYIVNYSAIKKMIVLSKSRIKIELQPSPGEEVLVSSSKTHGFRQWLDR